MTICSPPILFSMQMLDESHVLCYAIISDRVAETCEACDRGNSCGDSLFCIIHKYTYINKYTYTQAAQYSLVLPLR